MRTSPAASRARLGHAADSTVGRRHSLVGMSQVTAEDNRPGAVDRRSPRTAALLVVAVAVAVLVAAVLVAATGSRPLVALGLPDPGELTNVGLPAMRALAEVSMVLTIGALLLASFLVPPQKSGYLDVAGFRAVRVAFWTAAAWSVAALLMIPLSVADALGRPVTDVFDLGLLVDLVPRLATAWAWTLTSVFALIVLAGTRTVLSWGWTAVLFGVSLAGPLPVAFTGHSSSGGAHDVATNSLVLHLLAASLWVGGLAAVVVLAAARGSDRTVALATAVPRFSRLALVCWAVLALTGVINTVVRIPLPALFGSFYGLLILLKVTALLVLGVLGALHRRRTVPEAAAGRTSALVRLAAVEVLLMGVTMGLAVALGRSAPPDTGEGLPSRTEVLIGYDLPGPPDLANLLFAWRFDLIFGTGAVLLALSYLLGVRRLRTRGDVWPVGRTIAWLAGCATLLVSTSSGIGVYAPAMFSAHMAQHMLLSMLVPILLVLGGPITLALRALPPAGRDAPPGPREWLLAAIHSPVSRWLTHPLVALVLFVGSYYALYFTGLFPLALREHWAHVAMNFHFLIVGMLFFWPLIGIDPAPRRLPPAARLGILFVSVPFHAFFGITLMSANSVIGGDFYRTLGLPWVLDPLRDQQLGGGVAWASGEIPLLIVVLALLIQWSRQDERSAERGDRRADADGDAELVAYNAMLRRLAAGEEPFVVDERQQEDVAGHTNESGAAAEVTETPRADGGAAGR
ncbi:putative copper resistance protein D [Pseudonocardia thermophila]|uniref:Putative copper resistance protein D n=2 Tax=Pseudonocardia thermophila TaxID=1848 RepID=A0A1M7A448_PSETH|nr:putative copper resistance protein D [Pseudonocardia thermophila]